MILNFNILLKNYLHISNIRKLTKKTNNLYKIIDNCYIINILHTAVSLYKLYKIIFLLSKNKSYITLINTTKLNTNKFIYYLTKFTNSNCINTSWINGTLTNKTVIQNLIIIHLFISKLCELDNEIDMPLITKLKKLKIKYNFTKYLKNISCSKFVFILNLDSNILAVKECNSKNKFTMGVCDLNFNTLLTDLNILSNNVNFKSINFFIKFIISPIIRGSVN
ncbi:Ribosomal protein S2 family protein (apicoplast) [Babesia bovis T2Bo]|uniref:Rps2 n=1 Tax=Babesia bovis TaxID=5865 RepID=A7AXE1_BABBO|nr:Ribosomal protein S2 family protein [Babesia bovis T2Bo]EDO05064.1 Ribosomal protein S2 family protein [Babesia bovis T2Bo]|eukprot:YP_002290844.1 rps2 (apicoplast) [Babesia bovis T2Bo]